MSTATLRPVLAPRPIYAWVSARVIGDVIGSDEAVVKRLAAEGRLRTQQTPGCRVRYALADGLALAGVIDGAESQHTAPAMAG
jgi:hypothetical protein